MSATDQTRSLLGMPLAGARAAVRAPGAAREWAGDMTERAEALLGRSSAVLTRMEALLDEVEQVVHAVSQTNLGAARQVERSSAVLDHYEPVAHTGRPTALHAAEATKPAHVDAALRLLELVPDLLDLLVPAFRNLGELSPSSAT